MKSFGIPSRLLFVSLLQWLVINFGGPTKAADVRFINGFYEGAALVHAKTIKVEQRDKQGNVWLTLQIEHVYCGPSDLKETTFGCGAQQVATGGSSGMGRLFHFDPLPHEGETGIWWVASQAPQSWQKFHVVKNRCFATNLPSRKEFGPRYDQVLEWAQAVERVSLAARDQQLKLLQGFAQSKNFETSVWAMTLLQKEWGPAADQILRELASHQKLTAAAITALDVALQDRQGDDWRKSSARWELLERSLRAVETDSEAKLVLEHWAQLSREWRRQHLSEERCLEIVQRAFHDAECPDRIRNELFMTLLHWPFLTSEDDERIWSFAIDNIARPISSGIAGNAAFMLMDTRHRTQLRFRTLLKLYRDQPQPRVAEQLSNVLAKWHEAAAKGKATP
ncbi:MAG: hypothetical protein ACKV2Q_04005 [Planctomycetaceae bacterium]